jgi:hypothetical protein
MLSPTDRKLLGALLSRQEETGTAAELPPERVAKIAARATPSEDEIAALLASPLARDELILHRRLQHLRQTASPGGGPRPRQGPTQRHPVPVFAMGDPSLLHPWRSSPALLEVRRLLVNRPWRKARLLSRLWARLRRLGAARASRGGQGVGHPRGEPLHFEGPWASLRVEPGTGGAPHSLTLRLRPEVPGGPAGRAVEVREPQPGGLVWLTGCTDGAGVVRAAWAYVGLRPQDRPFAEGLRIVGIEPGPG